MKHFKILVIAALFTLSFFSITPAKAQTTTYYFSSISDLYTYLFGTATPTQAQLNSAYMSYFGTTTPTQAQINSVLNQYVAPSSSTALPIDGQAWILLMGAAIVGCYVLTKNYNALTPVRVK